MFYFFLAMDGVTIQNEPERFAIIMEVTIPSEPSTKYAGGRPARPGMIRQ
jgi:hypothetical protein